LSRAASSLLLSTAGSNVFLLKGVRCRQRVLSMTSRLLRTCFPCLAVERDFGTENRGGLPANLEALSNDTPQAPQQEPANELPGETKAHCTGLSVSQVSAESRDAIADAPKTSSEASSEGKHDISSIFASWIDETFRNRNVRRALLLRKSDSKVLASYCAATDSGENNVSDMIGPLFLASAAYAADTIFDVLSAPRHRFARYTSRDDDCMNLNHFGHRMWSITGSRGFQLSVYHLRETSDYCIIIGERSQSSEPLSALWGHRRWVLESHLVLLERAIKVSMSRCAL